MGSSGRVKLPKIWKALSKCAPGHEVHETTHHWRITYEGKSFPYLPKGEHGSRKRAEVEAGVVKSMARALGVLDCVKEELRL